MRHALVYASRGALAEAERLLPRGSVLETLAREAITRGDLWGGERWGFIFLDQFGLACRFVRRPGRERPKPRAWLITDIRPSRAKRTGAPKSRRLTRTAVAPSRADLPEGSGRSARQMTTTT